MASLIIPPECADIDSAFQFMRLAREKLRRLHNLVGAVTNGSAWHKWVRTEFKPRNHAITATELALRKEAGILDTGAGAEPGKLSAYQQADLEVRALQDSDGLFAMVDLQSSFAGLRAVPPLPDPNENFTGYTEVDPDNDIAVTAGKLAITTMDMDATAYVYADKGVAHFGPTFEHNVKFTFTGGAQDPGEWARITFWGVSNTIADAKDWDNANNQALHAFFHDEDGGANKVYIREEENAASDFYQWGASPQGTPYYPTAERTGNLTFELRLYDDQARTSLVDTLTVAVPNGRAYRYIFPCASHDISEDWNNLSLDVENLDLQEADSAIFFGANF